MEKFVSNRQALINTTHQRQGYNLTFSSPSATPVNINVKTVGQQDEARSSLIMGRKIDSPTLNVMRDTDDKFFQNPKEDVYLQKLNYITKRDERMGPASAVNALNQTEHDIKRQQFDFSMRATKNNTTIQYDCSKPGSKSKSGLSSRKKRAPSTQRPTSQVRKDQQKKAMASKQPVKKQVKTYQPAAQTAANKQPKNTKFEFKQTAKAKKLSNISQVHRPDFFTKKDAVENQENDQSRVNKQHKITRTPNKKTGLDLSISSVSHSSSGKKRYIDKQNILNRMSPARRDRDHSNNASNDTFLMMNRIMSLEHPDRPVEEEPIDSPPRFRGSSMPHNVREDYKQLRAKRTTPTHKGQKSFRVDRLVRDNIKKQRQKDEAKHIKRQMEDIKQKQKKQVLSQRNQEVRKINASRIQHQSDSSGIQAQMQNIVRLGNGTSNSNYKKQRSKSCMNRSDSLFVANGAKGKTPDPIKYAARTGKRRDKSFVIEIRDLKREIDQEIKQDILTGKIEAPMSAHKKSNMSTLIAKKELHHGANIGYHKPRGLNQSVNFGIKKKFNARLVNKNIQIKLKKHRDTSKGTNQHEIKRFIQKKKKTYNQKRSLEHTLEIEKHARVKNNLENLNHFVKSHLRHSSQNVPTSYISKRSQNRDEFPQKKLKPQFLQEYNKKRQTAASAHMFENVIIDQDQMFDKNSSDEALDISNIQLNSSSKKQKQTHVSQEFYEEYKKMLNSMKNEESKGKKPKKHLKMRPRDLDKKSTRKQVRNIDARDFNSSDANTIFNKDVYTISKSMSPTSFEQAKKTRSLIQKYGSSHQSETKLLIRLHTAAIIVQQAYRSHLAQRNFYKYKGRRQESPMYIDSDDDDNLVPHKFEHHQNVSDLNDTVKGPLSSLPVKDLSPSRPGIRQQQSQDFYAQEEHQDSDNLSDKVVHCSVITSGRQEDESMNNTQKYVPLRHKQLSKPNSDAKIEASSLSSGPRTAIKTDVHEYQRRDEENVKQNVPLNVPSLNLNYIKNYQEQNPSRAHVVVDHPPQSSSRSLFDRHPFQEFKEEHKDEDFQMQQYPEMIRLREEAIHYKEKTENKYMERMFKQHKLSPRTYDKKRHELETWVTKERDEIHKTKKVFEEQWKKTTAMIEQTQRDAENMKKILNDQLVGSTASHHNLPSGATPRSQYEDTLNSVRHTNRIMEMINEKEFEDSPDRQVDVDDIQVDFEEEERQKQVILEKQQKELNDQRIQQEKEEKERQEKQDRIDKEEQRKQQEKKNKELRELQEKREKDEQKDRDEKEAQKKKNEQEKARVERLENERKEREFKQKIEEQKQEDEKKKKAQLDKERIEKEMLDFKNRQEEENRKKREQEQIEKQKEKEKVNQKQKIDDWTEKLRAMEAKFGQVKKVDQVRPIPYQPSDSIPSDRHSDKNELKSEPDMDEFAYQEDAIINDIVNEDKRFKQESPDRSLPPSILEQKSFDKPDDSQFYLEAENSDDASPEQNMRSDEDEEPLKGLTRTRGSQDLQVELSEANLMEKSEESVHQNEMEGDDSPPPDGVHHEDFFTKNFDEERTEDLLEKMKNTSGAIDIKGIMAEKLPPNSNINIQDDEESPIFDENKPLSQIGLKNSLNVKSGMVMQNPIHSSSLEEQKESMGLPVSPVSEGDNIRIQTGSQSLESTLSDEKKAKNLIQEVNQENEIKEKQATEITNDIFRALITELKVELDMLLIRDNQHLFQDNDQQSHPNNFFLSDSGKFLIFDRKGIKTDLFAIERYVDEILDEVLKDAKKFLIAVNNPIEKKAIEVLNQLQNSEIGSYDHFMQSFPNVLPLELYLAIEKRRKKMKEEYTRISETSMSKEDNFLSECEHIHNKVLFDCINDSLLQFKPYGKDGVPNPWSRSNRKLKPTEDFSIEEMFEIVKHDLFRWAIIQAGTLPRKEFVFSGIFDDELFAEIREKKLATLLAREMIENEPKWLGYDFEEAQVKIDIGDMILETLVTETLSILNSNSQRFD